MYKGISGVVDREDYLTGRKIDKTFELLEKEENPQLNKNDDENNLFTGLQLKSDYLSKSDVANKMREDPLFEIKMKQLEQQKQLLKNPVKLKKLKDMLLISLEKDKHKKKHKKKSKHKKNKSKKSKKSKHSSSDSSDSSTTSSSDSNDHHHRRSNDKSHKNHDRYRDRVKNDWKKDYDRKRIETTRKFSNDKISSKSQKKPLTEEEMARRRQEMMNNAEWREKTRKDNVNKLNERDRLEEIQSKESFKNEPNFIKPILTNSDNIEDSVRRKRFKLQRGSGLMDEHFARKY